MNVISLSSLFCKGDYNMLGKIISAVVLAGTAAAAGYIAKKKNPDFCPECDIRKAVAKLGVHIKTTEKYDNGVALTPPMVGRAGTPSERKLQKKKSFKFPKL